MKKQLTILTLLLTALATAWAGEKTVTFQPGVDMGASWVSKDGIQIRMSGMDGANYYTIAPAAGGGTLDVLSYNYIIKKIEFTCYDSEHGPQNFNSTFTNHSDSYLNSHGTFSYSGLDGVWQNGLTQNIQFTVQDGKVVYIGGITVTYIKDNGDIYDLVTSNSELVEGGKYVIVSKYYGKSMSSLSRVVSNNLSGYDKQSETVEWINDEKTKVRVNDETQVITLKNVSDYNSAKVQAQYSVVDGLYYLRNTSDQIVNTTSPYTLYTSVTNNTNNNALISSTTAQGSDNMFIRYDYNNDYFTFKTYASSYTRVYLYKQATNYNVNFVAIPTGGGTANYTAGVVEINGQNTSQHYETVQFTLSPNSGYRVKEGGTVTVVDADGTSISLTEDNGVYSFTMPGKDVTITAEFEEWQPHSITTVCDPTSGGYFTNTQQNGASTDFSQGAQYYRGDEITFKVKTNWGYRIENVKMTYVNSDNESVEETLTPTLMEGDGYTYSISMPDYNITLTATFRVAEKDLYLLGSHNGQDWHSYGPKFNYNSTDKYWYIDVYYKGTGNYGDSDGDEYGRFSVTRKVSGNATQGDNWNDINGVWYAYYADGGDDCRYRWGAPADNTEITPESDPITLVQGDDYGPSAFKIKAGVYRIIVTNVDDKPGKVSVERTDASLSLNPAGGTSDAPVEVSWGTEVYMTSNIQNAVHTIADAYAAAYPEYLNNYTEADMSLSYNIAEISDLSTSTQSGSPSYTDPTFTLVDYAVAEDAPVTVKVDGDAWIGWIHADATGYYKVVNTPLHWIEHPDKGVVGQQYIVSDRLMGVYAMDNILWAKDVDYDSNNANSYPEEGEVIDYMKLFTDFMQSDDVPVAMQSARNEWEQKNWVQLDFTDVQGDYEASHFVNKYLNAGTVKGTYVDATNYKIRLTSVPTMTGQDQGGFIGTYQPNYYCPTNFMTYQGVEGVTDSESNVSVFSVDTDQGTKSYYFLNPKIQEYALITFAVWDGTRFVVANQSIGVNAANFDGAFDVNWVWNNWNNSSAEADQRDNLNNNMSSGESQAYIFHAIVQKPVSGNANGAPARAGETATPKSSQTPTGNYMIYPLDLVATSESPNIITAVSHVETVKAVHSVTYCDLSGRTSSKPFAGVNIVITRYSDGTVVTSKQVR